LPALATREVLELEPTLPQVYSPRLVSLAEPLFAARARAEDRWRF
jgi:hypothetical protein